MPEAIRRDGNSARSGGGAFFTWIGVALLLNKGRGIGLLGVRVITLAAQAARRFVGLTLGGFRVAVGLLFTVIGLLELTRTDTSLMPVLHVAACVVFLLFPRRGTSDARTMP